MSIVPLLVDCTNTDLSAESLFRTVLVTDVDSNPVVSCTLTDGTAFRALDCNDPPISLEDFLRGVVLADGSINFSYIPCP